MDSPEDARKNYFITLICGLFDISNRNKYEEHFDCDESCNKFLNDINCSLLWVSISNDTFKSSNQISTREYGDAEGNERRVVFLKKGETHITAENIKSSVMVVTLNDPPIISFYYALKNLYMPSLLNDSTGKEPQMQKLLTNLESRLRYTLNRAPIEEDNFVLTKVLEEINFWETAAKSEQNETKREQAEEFLKILKNLENDFSGMSNGMTVDVDDTIDRVISVLDDLWKANSHSYSHKRMERLMDVIGNNIVFYFQEKLDKIDVWSDNYNLVIDIIDCAISACSKWNNGVFQLCTVDWSSSSDRSWSIQPPNHELCSTFKRRLTEIRDFRSAHRQLTKLLSSSEQKELETNTVFSTFSEIKPAVCSPYTESKWKSAVAVFQKSLVPAENRVAFKLKNQFRHLKANTLQLLQEIKRYRELIQRPNISSHLIAERENLLALLQQYIDNVNVEKGSDNSLPDLPPVVAKIYWTRQLRSKIEDIKKVNKELLSDLSGCSGLDETCKSLLSQLQKTEHEECEQWVREISKGINNKELVLSGGSKVLRLSSGKLTEVNYNPRLARLIREVRLLSSAGIHIPTKIKDLSETAMKFVGQARSLEQIANFHNTIGDRIVPSQKPMLLPVAQELDKLMNVQQDVTWSDTEAVDQYIAKLQRIMERLSKENNKLAFHHNEIRDKVIRLMDEDLMRHGNAWKQGLKDIREIISYVENMKFPHMESWKLHWDYQLYKALERQYQLSLVNLHSHFPEIRIELIYRQQKLLFLPPVEEIRMKYYTQVKKFLSIPISFRGVSERSGSLFATIIPRNASRFGTVFNDAEDLFEELEKLKGKWSKWVSLGGINLDQLAVENLRDADDWDWNFRASKNLAQEIAKLQFNDEKVGCLNVSVLPIRGEIELHNRRYWDALVTSLQTSILRDIGNFENYISEAAQVLDAHPKTMSEIGENHVKHMKLTDEAPEMLKSLESTVKKNRTLANWTKEKIEQVNKLLSQWDNFQSSLTNYKSLIGRQVESIKTALVDDTRKLMTEMEKFYIRWQQIKPKDTDVQDAPSDVLQKGLMIIREKNTEWNDFKLRKEKLLEDYLQFDIQKPDFTQFEELENDLKKSETIWILYEEFHTDLNNLAKEEWIFFRNKLYRITEFLGTWEKRVENHETTAVTVRMLQEINGYKLLIPMLKYVRGEMFSEKHWLELFSLLQVKNKAPESLTLADFLSVKENIIINGEKLQDLNNRAASEITIRQALSELDAWEVQARFTLTQHTDSKDRILVLIKDFREVLNKIGDNQCLLQSIINSANSKNFEDRTMIWESKLSNLEECIRNLNIVQRKWVYLEPIFGNGNFAMEQGRFERIDQDFRYIMEEVSKDNHVAALTRIINLKQTLNLLLDQLGRCQKSLNEYLQEKRFSFPRFYFLGDDDLLELLGQSTKEKVIQAHLKKLFTGIHKVIISESAVRGVISLQGETVNLISSIKTTNKIEEWLTELDKEVKKTLKSLIMKYIKDEVESDQDLTIYPSQVLCLGESIRFTMKCEKFISAGKLQDLHKSLKIKLDTYTKGACQSPNGDIVYELKLKALILDTIHHLRVTELLMENSVTSVNDWHWHKQLRFYITPDNTVVARMLDAEIEYTYEYQGNNPKLVRTDLTEKCFLTLTQAMKMGLGGNPFGPAGTGKTESVKALGALLGRQVLVFNCDEGIDIKSMSRIFIGLVKCGAWGCFDEFNRLEEATLSAVSMLIQPIQAALKGRKRSVKIFDEQVEMNWNCGIFVTLNPAGRDYGGRQKLPDNLKQLFRSVIMSVPDVEYIAQIGLYCEGFKNATKIGRKLVEVFDLARHLLSKKQHYDWGLRALKTVLGSCGNLFKKARKQQEPGESLESESAVEAIRFNTLSKLTYNDSILFDQIVRDVFRGVNFVNFEFQQLTNALRASAEELGLQVNEHQIKKCVEVYEQMQQRMGVALVGPSGTGKTTIIKILKHGLEKTGRIIKNYVMNPKSMPRTQLLGHIDLDTRQWTEGVLTSSALKLHSESSEVWSWLICDGDIDPDWVEALNSVLDDNRLLTLPSGWRIQFGPNVNFVFETCDLSHASPATVSRMGIIFLSDESINISLIVNSWLNSQDENSKQFLEPYLSDYFYKNIEWVREKGDLVVPCSIVGLAKNGLSHMVGVKCKSQLAVAMMHGLGANLSYSTRQIFAKQVFECLGEFIPEPSRILDCYFNQKRERIDVFTLEQGHFDVSEDFPPILIPSLQSSIAVLEPWINSNQPILIHGPEGCGKNLLLNHSLSKLPATEVAFIYCNTLITPEHVLQKLKHLCMTTSSPSGRVLKPKNAQKLVLYFRNLELAAPDKWGTNMLIAWLQQVLGYNGFYDTDLEWTNIERIQIIGTISDSGNLPSQRLTSIMRIYHLQPPDEHDLRTIYTYYVKSIVEGHFSRYKAWSTSTRIASLVSTLLTTYQEVRKSFTQISHKTYFFTPRCLTLWCSGIRRYSIDGGNPIRSLLTAVVYEALRLFYDRLTSEVDRAKMKSILVAVMDTEWNQGDIVQLATDIYFASDSDEKVLTGFGAKDWTDIVKKGILMSLGNENDIIVIDELLRLTASIYRCLSTPRKSLTLCGKSGVGRKTAIKIVSSLCGARLMCLSMSHGYNIKNFKMDLKAAFQTAGIEGESVYLVIEGYQITDNTFTNMIASAICSGEIPGLYNTEELESIISQLKDLSSQDGFLGSAASYFAQRVLKNLHVILVLNCNETYFPVLCESGPSIYTKCEVIWATDWSEGTMKIVPRDLFSRNPEVESLMSSGGCENMSTVLAEIHRDFEDDTVTPRKYLNFVRSYIRLYTTKRSVILERINGLKAGVQKLTEARAVVDNLKREANKQEANLAEKRSKAASALDLIGETMKNANTHRGKMEKLKEQTVSENKTLIERKKAIDKELAEVEPLIGEARHAVGNIKNESLSEIRSLRAPPDVIRDILEGVLRLMGIQDTSWNSMKTFLAKRGIKEEIRTFDANIISVENREAVESLLKERKDSFDAKVAKRASVAAAPLAAWVKANITYAKVLEKIRPLEREQLDLERNLKSTEDQMGVLSTGLSEVDRKVAELKEQLNTYTREAAIIEINLAKAQETMSSAQELVSKLDDEYKRWKSRVSELSDDLKDLSKNVLVASSFIAYLASSPEETRNNILMEWEKRFGLCNFSVTDFFCSDRDKLKWISEGLASDRLSIENAVILLETDFSPLLIDPDGVGVEWLKKHFSSTNLEVVSQNDAKIQTIVELAIRFGKVLIIEDVNEITPVLMPVLRKSIVYQGPRQVIHLGDKVIDYHKDFRIFLVTRNINFYVPSDVVVISFLTTRKGLTRQLLTSAVQQERPELELRRCEIVKEQEEMKSKLFNLQEILLRELVSAQGDILQNKELLRSLNETKASSEDISKALSESKALEIELNKECEMFKPISEFASNLYFTIASLSEMSVMNQYSISAFRKLFQKSLKTEEGSVTNLEDQKRTLLKIVYNYVTRSLFKANRLTFALHLVQQTFTDAIKPEEWKVFIGEAISELKAGREPLPHWVDEDRVFDINMLRNSCPSLFDKLNLANGEEWSKFAVSGNCEKDFPFGLPSKLTKFEALLVVQAFRPDRLLTAMTEFCLKTLQLETLSPSMKLSQVFQESINTEPILLIVGPGADPSEELRILSKTMRGKELHEVALGQGQTSTAIEELKSCAESGEWLCLKNLHLMTSWLKELEKELRSLKLHDSFRLWMTTELHDHFSPVLANNCLKVVYEAPAGIKKNLQRTYGSWTAEMFRRKGVLFGRAMFAAAWLHAVVQERRNYIPQGWTKFYEITDGDLHATTDLIGRIFQSGIINWDFIHGVLLNTIYGGRMENDFDAQALSAYVREFFNESVLNKGRGFGPNLTLPSSESYPEYLELIHNLDDFDKPSYFGLPGNVERSWQKVRSSHVIDQIKVLHRPSGKDNFDVKSWRKRLSPILNLWKKINEETKLIEAKLPNEISKNNSDDPFVEFLGKDFKCGLRAVQCIHKGLAAISKVIRGVTLPNQETNKVARDLIHHQTPTEWQHIWEGPENPIKYIRAVVHKTSIIQKYYREKSSELFFNEDIDLSHFLEPEMLLKAMKLLTGRKSNIALDELELVCEWAGPIKNCPISYKIKNLQLEGAIYDGRLFAQASAESPSVTTAPVVHIGFLQKSLDVHREGKRILIPVYRSSERDRIIVTLKASCSGAQDDWLKTTPAFFLRESQS